MARAITHMPMIAKSIEESSSWPLSMWQLCRDEEAHQPPGDIHDDQSD
jgi:hypothetical protein